ncbi:MAG TPA: hypothetical protein VEZ42_14845 [Pseudonocardia sp.]|nr:hypothetical protein [Pseudonocardia sp.]
MRELVEAAEALADAADPGAAFDGFQARLSDGPSPSATSPTPSPGSAPPVSRSRSPTAPALDVLLRRAQRAVRSASTSGWRT